MRLFSRCFRHGAAAASAALCASLWAGQALAYCREVTDTPPDGYDPVSSGCFTSSADSGAMLPSLFWRNQCVGFNLQRDASNQVSLAEATSIATKAFATWSNASCPGGGSPSITAVDLTPVSCNQAPSHEHNNPIILRDTGWPHGDRANAIGYTTLTVNLDTGEILGAAVEINSTDYVIVTSGPATNGAYDLASILTHEAGHFLGLAHSADTSAVMYAYYHPGTSELTPDDIAGICSIYPTDGSRNTQTSPVAATACNPLPLGGLLDECGSLDAGTGTITLSTPAGDAGGHPPPMCPTPLSCGLVQSPASGSARGLAAGSLLALVAVARRTRGPRSLPRQRLRAWRLARAVRHAARAMALALLVVGTTALGARDAEASVSIAAGFDELIAKATAAAVVTPVQQLGVWEEGRIVTYTRARVERLVAGRIDGQRAREEAIWIRTAGGAVGHIGQIVEGEAVLVAGVTSLVFVEALGDSGTFAVVEGAQGQFSITGGEGGPRTMPVRGAGALVLPPGGTLLARDVLRERPLDDAAREIASAWGRGHAKR